MTGKRRSPSVLLDTSFAGVNPTGVGLYSRLLTENLEALQEEHQFRLSCTGPSCPHGRLPGLLNIAQEWPLYTQCVLPLLIARSGVDIVHSTSHLGPIATTAHLIVTVHDLIFHRFPDDYNPFWLATTRLLMPLVLVSAQAIIVDSRATANDLRRFYRVPKRKLRVIYPGVSQPVRSPYPLAFDLTRHGLEAGKYLLCLGPWVRRKNLSVAVEAFIRIAASLRDMQLVITGDVPAGMKGEPVQKLLNNVPDEIRKRIHLTGHISQADLDSLITHAGVLAYPSRFEGFGLPPLEAMSRGIPVVASPTPAVLEVTGGSALYANPDNPEEWADCIMRIMTQPAVAQHLQFEGLLRARQFTWERCARETTALYLMVHNGTFSAEGKVA